MIWPPPTAALLSVAAALVSAAVASYAWYRRTTTAARQLALIMLAVMVWTLGYALELDSPDLGAKLLWNDIEYLGIACLPATWILFVLAYCGHDRWRRGWGAALWFVIPALTIALNWTNASHFLYYDQVSLDRAGAFPMLATTPGPWYWVQICYSYLAVAIGMGLLWGTFRNTARIYRGQVAVILAGVCVPWFASLLYVSGANPLTPFDITPFAFVITGLVLAWGLFRYRLCTLVPMARDRVLDHMSDAVVVLDAEQLIVDLNLAAQGLFGELTTSAVGQPAATLFGAWPALVRACQERGEARLEITWERPPQCLFEVRVSPLYDQGGRISGRLLIWRDSTERHQAEALLQRRLRFIELIQRAANGFIRVEVGQIDEHIVEVLQAVATLFSVERGYVFLIMPERGVVELAHEWCAADVLPHRGVLDSVDIADFADFLESMQRGVIAQVQAHDIPATPENQAMNDVLRLLQIKSFVNIPLFISEQMIGWIGFDAVARANEWSDETIEAFLLAGQLIASAIHRQQTWAALRLSEQQFHSLFNHMIEGVALHRVVHDHRGQVVNYEILDVNPQYERILNLRREDVCHRLADVVYGTAAPPYLTEFTAVGKSGRPHQFETYFAPMGKHFSISVSPLAPDHFATIFFDITARKQAEKDLRESEERFRQMADNISEGLTIIEGERVVYVNDRACAIFGYARPEYSTRRGLDFAAPEERERLIQLWEAGKQDGRLIPELEFWIERPDGQRRYVRNRYSARVEGDRMVGRYVLTSDITERKQAELDQARLQSQLLQSQKMEAIGHLAGGIAHDFNNILTVISGNADLALLALPDSHPAYEDLHAIQHSAARAAQLVRQLLTFARRQASQPEVVDLNELVTGITPMLRRLIGEHIHLVFLPGLALVRVRIDPNQFEQVLINLVVNARDAMPRGGTLTLATANANVTAADVRRYPEASSGPYVSLMVGDTGEGMTDEVKEHIFEPYYTTKEVGRGTGLGLATCLGIIKQHHGFLWVESTAGCGSQFTVYLPCTTEAPRSSERAVPAAEIKGGTETVLVVEDEPEVRQLAVRVLRDNGYTVLEATSGQEAQQLAEALAGQQIHLLLTDLIMPWPGGLELARRLQAQRPGLSVLVMSGYADYRNSPNASSGVELPFLQKPFSPTTLLQQVRRALL